MAHDLPAPATPLAELPNLGDVSVGWLRQAGLHTYADLQAAGAVRAWRRVEALGVRPGLNLLYALEGALHGSHWLEVKRRQKSELLMQLEASREQDTL
jgi:DNA transformation protein